MYGRCDWCKRETSDIRKCVVATRMHASISTMKTVIEYLSLSPCCMEDIACDNDSQSVVYEMIGEQADV
jgi:hypothetical protein